jgi:hypothetical protein
MRKSDADVIGNKLRIRGALHQRLVDAAEKKGVSLNSEMASRLQASFEPSLEQAVAEKVGEKIRDVLSAVGVSAGAPIIGKPALTVSDRPVVAHLQAKLIVTAEALIATIEQMPVLERAAIEAAIEPVKQAIAAIDQHALAELRRSRSES